MRTACTVRNEVRGAGRWGAGATGRRDVRWVATLVIAVALAAASSAFAFALEDESFGTGPVDGATGGFGGPSEVLDADPEPDIDATEGRSPSAESADNSSSIAREDQPSAESDQSPDSAPPEGQPPDDDTGEAEDADDSDDAAPAEEAEAEETPPSSIGAGSSGSLFPSVRGQFSMRYRLRLTGDDSDQDLYAVLSLDVGDRDRDAVSAYVLARGFVDLNGRSQSADSVFYSIDDTYGNPYGRIYYGYFDYNRLEGFDTVRLGRQAIIETPEVAYLDGLRLETAPMGDLELRVGGYGGLSTRIYDSFNDGDYLAGAYLDGRPWRGGRARVDWMFAKDDLRFGIEKNNLFSLGLWQNFGRQVQVHGFYSNLEGESRDVLLRGDYYEPDIDLRLQASVYRQFTRQEQLALEFDNFYETLQEYEPYNQANLLVTKEILPDLSVDAGVSIRRLDDEDDEGTYNREFDRYYITPSYRDLILEGLDASVTFDWWDDQDTAIQTFGFDLTQRFDRTFRGSIGSYYSLYKYDFLTESERDNVRTYYLRLGYEPTPRWQFDLQYEYEDADFEEFSTLRVGAAWKF